MQATHADSKERTVQQLIFGVTTAKRAYWEAFEFSVEAPHLVRVTNVSYGDHAADHSYLVGVEKRGGYPVPAECDCPADIHREPDCKHKVALASGHGTTVLAAAIEYKARPGPFPRSPAETNTASADAAWTDDWGRSNSSNSDACPNGDARCGGPDGNALPCFDCYEVDQ